MQTIAGRRMLRDGTLGPGWVRIDEGTVVAAGWGDPPERADVTADVLTAGFVDLHMHGGGGHDAARSADDLAGAVAFHRDHGTTATLVSAVTAPVPALLDQLDRTASAAAADDAVLGAHLEGPFLAPRRCGAQHPDHLRAPDAGLARELIAAGRGRLRVITLAPELPGAIALVELFVASGVVVAVGHTDATYEQASTAFDAGASLVTHLGNAMRAVTARDPGPSVAALERGVVCEVINDGVHVHPALVRAAGRATRAAFVTDAVEAAGAPGGGSLRGVSAVRVRGGVARLADGGALAGSTSTMDAAVACAVADGWALGDALDAACSIPASVLGLDAGITVGDPARLVLLDDRLRVQQVVTPGG